MADLHIMCDVYISSHRIREVRSNGWVRREIRKGWFGKKVKVEYFDIIIETDFRTYTLLFGTEHGDGLVKCDSYLPCPDMDVIARREYEQMMAKLLAAL